MLKFFLLFLPALPIKFTHYSSFILILQHIIPILLFFTSCLSFNLSLSSLSPSFISILLTLKSLSFLSAPFLIATTSSLITACILFEFHNYPISYSQIIIMLLSIQLFPNYSCKNVNLYIIILQNYAGPLPAH